MAGHVPSLFPSLLQLFFGFYLHACRTHQLQSTGEVRELGTAPCPRNQLFAGSPRLTFASILSVGLPISTHLSSSAFLIPCHAVSLSHWREREGTGVGDASSYKRQVGENQNKTRGEGCNCGADLLFKNLEKEILLEVEQEKNNACQAPPWQAHKWIVMYVFQTQNLSISHSFNPDGRAMLLVAFGSNFCLLLGM